MRLQVIILQCLHPVAVMLIKIIILLGLYIHQLSIHYLGPVMQVKEVAVATALCLAVLKKQQYPPNETLGETYELNRQLLICPKQHGVCWKSWVLNVPYVTSH